MALYDSHLHLLSDRVISVKSGWHLQKYATFYQTGDVYWAYLRSYSTRLNDSDRTSVTMRPINCEGVWRSHKVVNQREWWP